MKKRILIVEDNEKNRCLEKDLLEAAGFEVLEAETASAGIAIARAQKPDLILMDVRLPDMSGTKAAKILSEDAATRYIQIVFVSASVIGPDIEEVKAVQGGVFISKPINTGTFVKTVSGFLP